MTTLERAVPPRWLTRTGWTIVAVGVLGGPVGVVAAAATARLVAPGARLAGRRRGAPQRTLVAAWCVLAGTAVGLLVGAGLGLDAHPATAWAAAWEVGVLGVVAGALVGALAAGVLAMVDRTAAA